MMADRNYIEAINGRELTAAEIERSGCSVIVVVPPAEGPAVEHAVIHLPRAAAAKRELTVVMRWGAFGYMVAAPGETINGQPEYLKPGGGGTRLVPLVSDDGASDGWGTV